MKIHLLFYSTFLYLLLLIYKIYNNKNLLQMVVIFINISMEVCAVI